MTTQKNNTKKNATSSLRQEESLNRVARDAAVKRIAAETLMIETLDARNRDSLDFHSLGVWLVRKALEQAYEAGRSSR